MLLSYMHESQETEPYLAQRPHRHSRFALFGAWTGDIEGFAIVSLGGTYSPTAALIAAWTIGVREFPPVRITEDI